MDLPTLLKLGNSLLSESRNNSAYATTRYSRKKEFPLMNGTAMSIIWDFNIIKNSVMIFYLEAPCN